MSNDLVKFVSGNKIVEIDFLKEKCHPSTTVLNYLRKKPELRGTKEGCAEGDCGACTVVLGEVTKGGRITYKAVNSCLLFLPAIHGKQLITIEDLAERKNNQIVLHPVQQAMIEYNGSQCGFCTPGIVMALFAFFKSDKPPTHDNVVQALSGNLCRCTGYDSIVKAAIKVCENRKPDHFDKNEVKTTILLSKINSTKRTLEIKTHNQSYFLPDNLHNAQKYKTENPGSVIINGATDTAIKQNKTCEFLPQIIDISAVDELKRIYEKDDGYYFGAGVTIEKLKDFANENLKTLLPLLDVFASWQIRNVATIGGNLATSSPVGDLIPLFIALKAQLELGNHEKSRWVEMDNFITGYRKNCMKPGEFLLNVFVPKPEPGIIIKSEKVSTRRHLDISTLSIAMRLKVDDKNIVEDITLAFGGMAETPKRAVNTEKYFLGKPFIIESAIKAANTLEKDFTPISDARAEKEYRITATKNLLQKMILY